MGYSYNLDKREQNSELAFISTHIINYHSYKPSHHTIPRLINYNNVVNVFFIELQVETEHDKSHPFYSFLLRHCIFYCIFIQYCIGKNHQQLAADFDEGLAAIKSDGTFENILDKHGVTFN